MRQLLSVHTRIALVLIASALSTQHVHAQQEQGKASYYSDTWKGRRTSSGERYQPDSLTAAHKTLPFGTLVKVTNQANGKSVVVKVNDRGPFIRGRIIDLSGAAAQAIDMVRSGIAAVTVEVVPAMAIADTLPQREIHPTMQPIPIVLLLELGPEVVYPMPSLPAFVHEPEQRGRKRKTK